ncbi:HAMP domain-containing protein [Fulvivirga sp. M361]|uniref:GAF domain-containing protein n=1 Tax=Fulvivirga sp. M361 TaxID=2594266 RepID=UPI00117BC9C6|nr:GAF domain-containing protein [Fulvivirga sp. M361]TRX58680.1 HAMP domain-containing protein [Fulvivirga sp. M361]
MKGWILQLKIRLKLLLAFGSILLMSLVLIIVVIRSTRSIQEYNTLNEQVDQLTIMDLRMNNEVKDFYSEGYKQDVFQQTGKSAIIDAFTNLNLKYDSLLTLIAEHQIFDEQDYASGLNLLHADHEQMNNGFRLLINLFKKRGFKDYGLEGDLRSSIHGVENSTYPYNPAEMLMLRRHEKDFFLRKDLKYLDRFNKDITVFKTSILEADSSDNSFSNTILQKTNSYRDQFNAIVTLEKKIGLNRNSGAIGQIHTHYKAIGQRMANLTQLIKKEKENYTRSSFIFVFSLLGLQLVLGLFLVVVYSNILTKAIKEIKSAIVALSNGTFPKSLNMRTADEIAETKRALNQLVARIREAVNFARDLGEGKLHIKYNEQFTDDVLAMSIITMQDKLVEINEKQKITNWTNEGLAKFSEILKDDFKDLESLSNSILSQLVNYINVNQGVLYHVNSEDKKLHRIATYAYGKRKFVDEVLSVGQGLAGQCVLEADTIYLSQLPNDYVKITSGLGEATPRNLLIVPLKSKDIVIGVLELASFQVLKPHEIKLVERVSENISNIILTRRSSDRTKKLLKESQLHADSLLLKEEKLRQNAEELQATQEQMQRNEAGAKKKIKDLEKNIRHKNQELALLRKQLVSTARSTFKTTLDF